MPFRSTGNIRCPRPGGFIRSGLNRQFIVVNLQRAVDEKFRCVEEKEEEVRRLQLLLREKERDLERQRCVLANNEETITVRKHTHT